MHKLRKMPTVAFSELPENLTDKIINSDKYEISVRLEEDNGFYIVGECLKEYRANNAFCSYDDALLYDELDIWLISHGCKVGERVLFVDN